MSEIKRMRIRDQGCHKFTQMQESSEVLRLTTGETIDLIQLLSLGHLREGYEQGQRFQ